LPHTLLHTPYTTDLTPLALYHTHTAHLTPHTLHHTLNITHLRNTNLTPPHLITFVPAPHTLYQHHTLCITHCSVYLTPLHTPQTFVEYFGETQSELLSDEELIYSVSFFLYFLAVFWNTVFLSVFGVFVRWHHQFFQVNSLFQRILTSNKY